MDQLLNIIELILTASIKTGLVTPPAFSFLKFLHLQVLDGHIGDVILFQERALLLGVATEGRVRFHLVAVKTFVMAKLLDRHL